MHIPALLQFLAELHQNNNKSWFLHNKPHYDILRAEFIDLVDEVGRRVQKFDTDLGPFEAKKALFRIYRDVRFSKDKSPLKTHMGAVIGARTTDKSRPVYYLTSITTARCCWPPASGCQTRTPTKKYATRW